MYNFFTLKKKYHVLMCIIVILCPLGNVQSTKNLELIRVPTLALSAENATINRQLLKTNKIR